MRDLRVQYFLTFAVIGAVLPYVSVFFRQAGLTEAQVGYAWAMWSAAVVCSPVVVTLAADRRHDPRRLLVLASVLTCASLLALGLVRGVAPVLAVWAVYCLSSLPVLTLQDGIHFSEQRRRAERGESQRPYHLVRVWGTVGFIIPSILLFVLLEWGMSLRACLWTGAACAALSAFQATRLADPRPRDAPAADAEAGAADSKLPTLAAARTLLQPHLLAFTAAIVLVQMAGSVHAAFYPIYLTEKVGVGEKWLGQASNLAVFIEIFFVYGCGALVRVLGVRKLLLLATIATATRFALLAASEHVAVAFATQAFHGIFLVAVGVLPQMILDENAGDRFRHSMQGVFVMVTGSGRVVASAVSGPIAAWSISGLYGCAAALCVAAGLILFAYPDSARASKEADVEDREPAMPSASTEAT
ncbi:MAG TPA: MFS transporter [Tepidisphaeraceae bacterium]|nr:MFS transporter [Tepidisphaeraceae bacterium]